MADTQYTPRMRKLYDDVVRQKIFEQFGYANPMEVPRIEKVVLNMGIGESTADGRIFLKPEEECLAACCGAPMMQVDHVYYENLTPERVDEILDGLS